MPAKERQKRDKSRAAPLKERFRYWFDNRIAGGSLGLIRFLIALSIILALIIAGLIILFGFHEDSELTAVFWDSIATIINAWMPYSDDGSIGYLLLMTVTAIGGLLFTSVLIGIVTSAIEEKIIELKRGNSKVVESGHTVILGFYPGEYTLLQQLILAADGRKECVVIAEDMERDEMEQSIRENVDCPRNFRIICRSADITDPSAIERCAVSNSRTVIIHPTEDARTVKALLAVTALLRDTEEEKPRILALLRGGELSFPPALAERCRITALREYDTLAKMIAHSCTQMGLSETFRELFNFDGSEWYVTPLPEAVGLRFDALCARLDGGAPAGLLGPEGLRLNPPADTVVRPGDRLLVFAEDRDHLRLTVDAGSSNAVAAAGAKAEEATEALILGRNDSLSVILRELPDNVRRVLLAGNRGDEETEAKLAEIAEKRGFRLEHFDEEIKDEATLLALVKTAEHVVILSDHDKDEEEADMETTYLLLNLRDIRERHALRFNITTEMRRERNQNLVVSDDHTDFVVASSMSSLILAQLAESPELIGAFREILSNEGNELYLRRAAQLGISGKKTVRDLRLASLSMGYVLLGVMDASGESCFNPPLERTLDPEEYANLIVLGEE